MSGRRKWVPRRIWRLSHTVPQIPPWLPYPVRKLWVYCRWRRAAYHGWVSSDPGRRREDLQLYYDVYL